MTGGYQKGRSSGPSYLEEYEGVDNRIAAFRKDYPGIKGRIETIDLKTEKAIIWRAEISVRDGDEGTYHLIATGHAFDPWGQSSQYEKTEKSAIGRALVMAGYASKAGASREEVELDEQRSAQRSGHVQAVVDRERGTVPSRATQARDGATGKAPAPAPTPEAPPEGEPILSEWIKPPTFGRPAYRVIIKKAQEMALGGEPFEAIKDLLGSKKRAMNEEEIKDAQKKLGEIQRHCTDRDTVIAAEAELAEALEGESAEEGAAGEL